MRLGVFLLDEKPPRLERGRQLTGLDIRRVVQDGETLHPLTVVQALIDPVDLRLRLPLQEITCQELFLVHAVEAHPRAVGRGLLRIREQERRHAGAVVRHDHRRVDERDLRKRMLDRRRRHVLTRGLLKISFFLPVMLR